MAASGKDDIYDALVIGSGAGGGPLAYELAKSGARVLILEKGRRLARKELIHDELKICRGDFFTPSEEDEPHVLVRGNGKPTRSHEAWLANCVGGGTVHMSGFFLRLKPEDFRLRSELGDLPGTNLADWPITYAQLAPYYDRVERVVSTALVLARQPSLQPGAEAGTYVVPALTDSWARATIGLEHPARLRVRGRRRRVGRFAA